MICLSSFSPFAYWIISNAPLFLCPWPFLFCLQIIFQAFKSFPSSSLILSSIRFFFSGKSEAKSPSRSQLAQPYWWHRSSADFFQARIWLEDCRSACLADAATLQGPCCANWYLQRPLQMLVHTGGTDNPMRQGKRVFNTTRWQSCRCLYAGFWSNWRRANSLDLTLLAFNLPQTALRCLRGVCFLPSAANWSSVILRSMLRSGWKLLTHILIIWINTWSHWPRHVSNLQGAM